MLRRSSRQLTLNAKRQFLISVIQPDLEYAAVAVIPTMSASNRSRLLALWRKAVRCAAGADWQSEIKPLLVKLRLSHIEDRWALQLALVVRRCHLNIAPGELCKRINRVCHNYGTRGNALDFRPFRPNSRAGSICFSNRAPLLWNSLPDNLKQNCNSLLSFKSKFLVLLSVEPKLDSLAISDTNF